MKIPTAWAASILALVIGAPAGAQVVPGPPPPPRDARQVPQTGTSGLKGRVVDGQSGAAVARAIVRLGGPAGQRPSALTDASGAFAFTALPAGSYTITVEKPGYVQSRFPEGGRTMRTQFRPLTLAAGEVRDDITIPLHRGGVIAGRVFDMYGEPVEYAQVAAMRVSRSGAGRPSGMNSSSVNDIGEFRVPRLQPGSYLLMVTPRRMGQNDDALTTQPITTYYPGVAAMDQAQPIVVERGAIVAGIDIMLAEGTLTQVTGSIVTPDGQPAVTGGYINVRRVMKDMPFMGDSTGASMKPDGTFQFKVAPGEYDIEANYMPRTPGGAPPRQEDQMFGVVRISVGTQPATDVVIPVGRGATVTGRFVFEGSTPLPATTPLTQFRVMFGSNGPGCRTGRSETSADGTFTIEGLSGTCTASFGGGLGPYTLKAIVHGRTNLLDEPITFTAGQQLRDVQVIFTDKRTQMTLQVSDEQGQPTREYVALVFAIDKDRWTGNSRYVRTYMPPQVVSTTVTSGAGPGGSPRATPQVVEGGIGALTDGMITTPGSGTVTITRSAQTIGPMGMPPARREVVGGMPAGEYYVVALDDIEPELARDPAVFERLKSVAQRVTLTEGSPIEVALRRTTMPAR